MVQQVQLDRQVILVLRVQLDKPGKLGKQGKQAQQVQLVQLAQPDKPDKQAQPVPLAQLARQELQVKLDKPDKQVQPARLAQLVRPEAQVLLAKQDKQGKQGKPVLQDGLELQAQLGGLEQLDALVKPETRVLLVQLVLPAPLVQRV